MVFWPASMMTLVPEAIFGASKHHHHDSCKAPQDRLSFWLSMLLCFGLILSYLPQIIRIVKKKSSLGFSPWFLLLGATSSASTFLNVVSLQWGVVRCCMSLTAGKCLESLLGIFQVGLQWLLFVSILVLFLVYYPKDLRYERSIALPPTGPRPFESGVVLEDEEEEETGDDESSDGAGESGVAGYSTFSQNGTPDQSNWTIGESAVASRFAGADENDPASSSAFDRLVPTFWPVWKAPARKNPGPSRLGPGVLPATGPNAEHHVGLPVSYGGDLPPNATAAARGNAETSSGIQNGSRRGSRSALLSRGHRRSRRIKHKTPEWSLAVALGWVTVLHFIFVLLVTLLLVSTLPPSAFPPPSELPLPGPPGSIPPSWSNSTAPGTLTLSSEPTFEAFGPTSRLLISRWAAFLGITGTLLAAAQYIPQLLHTYRTKLVGSLSIPTMLLQVPGSVLFVWSLSRRPGIEWTSLAAYAVTGLLQLGLLILCVMWKGRQKRMGIDDYGRPLPGLERFVEEEEED